jgi:hypothetical protein
MDGEGCWGVGSVASSTHNDMARIIESEFVYLYTGSKNIDDGTINIK